MKFIPSYYIPEPPVGAQAHEQERRASVQFEHRRQVKGKITTPKNGLWRSYDFKITTPTGQI
jgi:hypothetical protein